MELQEKDYAFKNEIEQLKKEKDTLEAKYLKNLKSADVKKKKLSGGFKSPEVMRHFVICLSLYMTCKVNGKNFDKLLDLIFSSQEIDLSSFLSW